MSKEELREIDIETISVNPYQPRRFFSQEELEELAASIKEVGLIHPPVVRPLSSPNTFELVSGERRLRAAQLAKLTKIPAIVRHGTESFSAHAALIENVQRTDLNPIEIAQALNQLSQQFNLRQEELAQKIGKKRSTIANYLRLLQLPQVIQNSVSEGTISMGHAKAILSLDSHQLQQHLFRLVLLNALSVRETEETAKKLAAQGVIKGKAAPQRNIHIDRIVEKLQQKLGSRVAIRGKGSKGRIQIDYLSLDDLDRILAFFSIQESEF